MMTEQNSAEYLFAVLYLNFYRPKNMEENTNNNHLVFGSVFRLHSYKTKWTIKHFMECVLTRYSHRWVIRVWCVFIFGKVIDLGAMIFLSYMWNVEQTFSIISQHKSRTEVAVERSVDPRNASHSCVVWKIMWYCRLNVFRGKKRKSQILCTHT